MKEEWRRTIGRGVNWKVREVAYNQSLLTGVLDVWVLTTRHLM